MRKREGADFGWLSLWTKGYFPALSRLRTATLVHTMKKPKIYTYRKVLTNNGLNFTCAFKTWLWNERDKLCEYCGDPIDSSSSMHVDHVVARASGGSNDLPNLRSSCRFCNCSKGSRGLEYLRDTLRLKNSDLFGIITVNQLLQLEAKGIALPVANTFQFRFEMLA